MEMKSLVEEYRGDVLENIHAGVICGVDERKNPIYRIGNIQHNTFYRSAAKPIQAIPAFLAKVDLKYELSNKEAALFTASHRGETYHIEALETMIKKFEIDEDELYCPYAYPLNAEPKDEMLRQHKEKRKLYHNCSGKHLGFIATCRELGYATKGYWEINHPLQQKILNILAYLSEVPVEKIQIAKDGCGVPIFAIPLHNMAITSLKLACPDLINDLDMREAVQRMTLIMNTEHDMIASKNFICSTLLKDQNIVAKGGAKGVYCFGLKKERIGFALKIFDGSEEVWPNVIASILEQINYINRETIANVRSLRPSIIRSDGGLEVGHIDEVFMF